MEQNRVERIVTLTGLGVFKEAARLAKIDRKASAQHTSAMIRQSRIFILHLQIAGITNYFLSLGALQLHLHCQMNFISHALNTTAPILTHEFISQLMQSTSVPKKVVALHG